MELPIYCLLMIFIIVRVNGDMYMHNPRGSNDRLNERSRQRRNANRLFDSQNNNRGGYNVGEGSLYYYSGSELPIEWTNQHSCANPNNNCEIIIQYMCGEKVRDGTTTSTIPEHSTSDCLTSRGMHEDYKYYQDCKRTERNKGLFTATQKLRSDKAIYTRQNPNGQRRGFECPEERDYYPYWRPSPWRDIVIMTKDVKRCAYYKAESQNVKPRSFCELPQRQTHFHRRKTIPNNQKDCEAMVVNGERATWVPKAAYDIPAPDCIESKWSRDNHLGNGKGGFTNKYMWRLPDLDEAKCVLRIRYNISTNDYDSWNTTSRANKPNTGNQEFANLDIGNKVGLSADESKNRGYVFKNNPEIEILGSTKKLKLRLAINTAQYGRTFQDRSHVFSIRKLPDRFKNVTISNLNVRGKRGNIVQVFPGVEYDFVPNRLAVAKDDLIHFQWTGSNTNPHNNAGQGPRGTDRSNVVLLRGSRYDEGTPNSITPNNDAGQGPRGTDRSNDVLLGGPRYDEGKLNSITPPKYGQFGNNYPAHLDSCMVKHTNFSRNEETKIAYMGLNRAYFDFGPKKAATVGTFFYMCTRNNAFSNRNQKGKIVVTPTANGKSNSVGSPIKTSADAIKSPDGSSGDNKLTAKESSSDIISPDNEPSGIIAKKSTADIKSATKGSSGQIGWAGGDIMLSDGIQGISVQEDSVRVVKSFNVQEMSTKEGEDYIKSKGGKMDKGDNYASKFMMISPMEYLTENEAAFRVKMKTDPEINTKRTIYHSIDTKTWHEVNDVHIDKESGLATFDATKGGLYVTRTEKDEAKRESDPKNLDSSLQNTV